MFSDFIDKQYERLKANLPSVKTDIDDHVLEDGVQELLELVSQYEGFKTPQEFIVSRIKLNLLPYTRDLRFGRWLNTRKTTN